MVSDVGASSWQMSSKSSFNSALASSVIRRRTIPRQMASLDEPTGHLRICLRCTSIPATRTGTTGFLFLHILTTLGGTKQQDTARFSFLRPSVRSSFDIFLPFSHDTDTSIASSLCLAEEARRLARLRTLISQDRSKQRYDRRRKDVCYVPADFVWLWTPIRKRGLSQKLFAQYTGPFIVIARINDLNCVLSCASIHGRPSKKTQVTHVARMKLFR